MAATPQSEKDGDLLAHLLDQRKNPWPGAIMFLGFLAFVYKMTELFVR